MAESLGGTTLEQTPIGRILDFTQNTMGVQLPGLVWDAASMTFARNATGTATAVILSNNPASTWASVELPILTSRGISIFNSW